jgi:hypothetical protein
MSPDGRGGAGRRAGRPASRPAWALAWAYASVSAWVLSAGLLVASSGCEDQPRHYRVDVAFGVTTGYVWDGFEGRPLAEVEVYSNGRLSGRTDGEGYYVATAGYDRLESWQMVFVKEGFKARAFGMPDAATADAQDPGAFRLDVVLTRGGDGSRR